MQNITFSQTAVESVLNDIRTGNTSYVDEFFTARPDWQEKEETDKPKEEEKEAAKA
jgi:hypothetical protein